MKNKMVPKEIFWGVVPVIVFVLTICSVIVSFDRRHIQLTEGELLRGTVLSANLGEPDVAVYTDDVTVRTDDGRILHTGSTKLPVFEGCRVTLQCGKTRLLGLQEFRIIKVATSDESSPSSASASRRGDAAKR